MIPLRKLKEERGQTSVFMALFIFTMIMLFAFTTNVGMLVHAKINLQNAADAAAYAGAAVQARQLTNVAYLNWEMRRAVKEFLYYYQVRSQYAAMPCFPINANGDTLQNIPTSHGLVSCPPTSGEARHDFAFVDPREPGTINETGGPFMPSVCIIFNKDNNYCQKAGVPGIPEFQAGGAWGVADPIVSAVRSATNQIIDKKIADCVGRTEVNQAFLGRWLWNLNPYKGADAQITTGRDSDDPFPFADGLERLGILPRQAILRSRIDNLEEALNMNLSTEDVGGVTITTETMNGLRNAAASKLKGLDYFERPIQAFLSAKNNLPGIGGDNGIFSNIQLTELVPDQAGDIDLSAPGFFNDYIENPPRLVKFKDQLARVHVTNSRFRASNIGGRGGCLQDREVRVIPHFPYGVSKFPGIITYYAVRLEAKARLLFSPFGGNGIVTLSAYSAAKPFGSRIGRDLSSDGESEAHMMVADGKTHAADPYVHTSLGARFPNVLVSAEDSDSQTGGFARNAHLGYIRGAQLFYNRTEVGPRLAGAYAPWEIGFYTPPANYQSPASIGLFEDNPLFQGKFFTMVAPIFPWKKTVSGLDFLTKRVLGYFQGGVVDDSTLEGKFREFKDGDLSLANWSRLFDYLNDKNQVVNHFIPDPLLNDDPDLLAWAKTYGRRFTVAGLDDAQRRQLTSWNNQKTALDQDLEAGGRIPANSELGLDIGRSGYSVRFISFKNLQAGGRGTNDPLQPDKMWSNPLARVSASGDNQAKLEDDLRKIKH